MHQVFIGAQLVYQDVVKARGTALQVAAHDRVNTVRHNIESLGEGGSRRLLMRLPDQAHLQLRSEIMALPFDLFVEFLRGAPLGQEMEPAKEALESGTLPVLEASVGVPASATAGAIKMESDHVSSNPHLRLTPFTTQPINESKSQQVLNGSTKRMRKDSTSPGSPKNTSASDTKNARNPRQSKRKCPSTARSAQHKHILAHFSAHEYDVYAARTGDDWEEFLFEGETRLVGWQWLNGYARRVIKCPFAQSGIRWLYRKEELALEKAGLRLDHDYGMGKEVLEDA